MPGSNVHVALVAATANLVLCAAVGSAVLLPHNGNAALIGTVTLPGTNAPDEPSPSSSSTAESPPASSEASATLPFTPVAGDDGLTTVVPAGWPAARLPTQPHAFQATDPADASRFVRFGGSLASGDLRRTHEDYERDDAARRLPGLTRIAMTETVLHDVPALDWEFEWNAPEGRRHVRSLYWRVDGIEYFVYASSTVQEWPEMPAILQAMADNARP
jgi:hypothetical protein